ncbi:hypothetical protein ATCC90586_000587 [Pythium insidiosum]|nr:hypothetical protein ATCC90586_000587 [Pythium insidiosum]
MERPAPFETADVAPAASDERTSEASPRSPRSPFHKMDVVVVDDGLGDNNLRERMSLASSNGDALADKRFACQFDPTQRGGRSLMLRFDLEGNATFEEMSRVDVLRMAQDAATGCTGAMSAARPVRMKGVANAPFGTIVDVQRVHARDIRKLDNAFSVSNEASIELRNQAILINADPVRAIIMRHSCLVFVPDGADSLLLILKDNFATAHVDAADMPYEFRALEALLGTLCQYFSRDYDKTAPIIATALDRLAAGKTSASELEKLRSFKNTMNEFESQVDGVRRALLEILDNEEDLRLLYLTKLHSDPSLLSDLWSYDSEEAEVLIENYLQEIVSTRTKALLMQHRIQNTESLVMLKLDSMRNYLLGVDIFFSILAISISIGTFIAGVFGMNLKSSLEDADGWFWGVVVVSVILMVVCPIIGVLFFKRKGVFLHSDPLQLSDLWSYDSEEAEVLIENYLQEIVSTRTTALLIQHRIQNTESLVMLKLDSYSSGELSDHPFACDFDPSSRTACSLMLRFDADGGATFVEMNRADVLKMTHEVATTGVGSMTASEAEAVVHAAHMTGGVDASAPFGKIVDVQRVHARDIRKLDNAFSVTNEASIELRNQAILIGADPLRSIIMRHCCLVFVPDGADSLLLLLQRHFLWQTGDNGPTPFEFRALEALLGTLCQYFSRDYDKTAPIIATALDRLAAGKTSTSELEKLRSFKNTMNEFESQVDGVRRALLEILDNEEDLRLLYLTKLHSDPSLLSDLWSYDSEEAEVLIENYLQEIVSTRTKALLMQHRIQNTESLVMLKLDSMRNYLLGVDIFFSILAISISIGTFIAGVFGMNLKSSLEEADGWFWGVTCGTIGLIILVVVSSGCERMAPSHSTTAELHGDRPQRSAMSSTAAHATDDATPLMSPAAPFTRMDVVVIATEDATQRPSRSASRSAVESKFACEFDPTARSGRSLMLRFDADGGATFVEMNRADVLKMTHEVATTGVGSMTASEAEAVVHAAHMTGGVDASAPWTTRFR